MLHYACLFAHDQPSTPESDWDIDNGRVDGWAEWFEQMPLLFLYLIGDAARLPQVAPFAVYNSGESLACLVAPMAEVHGRWLALDRHMQPRLPQLSGDARTQWAHMDAVIAGTTRQWLVLDCSMLIDAAIGTPDMDAFLHELRQRCAAWGELPDTGVLPPALQPLLDEAAGQWGWWDAAVIERIYAVEQQPYEDWPAALRERYEPANDWHAWFEEVQAYFVRPIDRSGDAPSLADSDQRQGPVGLVTPYGRWLVHPDEGAHQIHADAGCLCIHQQGEWRDGIPSGLKDFNGRWVVPVSAGYSNLSPVTKTLAWGWRGACLDSEGRLGQLLRWPEGESLFDDISGAWLHEDGKLRVTHADDTQSVLDAATGEPLFTERYNKVWAFHEELRIAIVERWQSGDLPAGQSGKLLGVVHESGRVVIPCEYAGIEHPYKEPPELLHGEQLLAITRDGQPHFYGIDGTLRAAPDCTLTPWTMVPTVTDGHLFAFDGEGPEAQAIWVSLDDYSFTSAGETRAECMERLKGEFLDRVRSHGVE